MSRKSIPFSKGYSLFYDRGIDAFLESASRNFDTLTAEIKSSNIKEIFIIHDLRGIKSSRISEAINMFNAIGIKCSAIPFEHITKNNFDMFYRLGRHLNSRLKTSSSLFLYSENQSSEVESFLASLLISGKNVSITPEQALYVVSGKEHATEKIDTVYKFKEYISKQETKHSAGSESSKHKDSSGVAIRKKEFKRSPFTIRVKLLTLVSIIVGSSMLILITTATKLFREHSETLIQEYNLSLARITGMKVTSDFDDLILKTGNFGKDNSTSRKSAAGNDEYAKKFFAQNKSFIFIGVAEKTGNLSYKFLTRYSNPDLMEQLNISRENLKKSHTGIQNNYTQSTSGAIIYENISSFFNLPVMALIVPLSGTKIAVAYIETSTILKSFQSARQSEIFQIFMVNTKGEVLIHSNEKISKAEKNLSDVPIVSGMMKSTVNNGSQKYVHEGIEYLGSFHILNRGNLGIISTAESDRVFAAVYRIQRQNILIMIIVLTLAFVLVYFTAKTLTIPLINLLGATIQIEEGLYDLDIKPTSRDEIGILTNSFIGMAQGLKEREQMKDIFGKFVNKHIAERALTGNIELGGTKKKCTILFTDLRNFTGISETLLPDQLVAILNEYFTEMVDCIYRNDGIVDKFIGDAIMAHWGALYSTDNDTLNAVISALEMREALIRFNKHNKELNRPLFYFGCGINTGIAIAGQIGSDKKLEYTVIGDSVNFASRIEYLNKDFKTDILISDAVKKEVEPWIQTVELEPVSIRGKKEEQILHVVLGRKNDPGCPGSVEELRKLIGLED